MTTVAYKDGILAADSQSWQGDVRSGLVKKIRRLNDGSLIGVAGTYGHIQVFADWWHKGGDLDNLPQLGESTVIHIRSKTVTIFEYGGHYDISKRRYWSGGSGHVIAKVAMECGKNAYEAVKVAVMFDAWSGGPVRHMRLRS